MSSEDFLIFSTPRRLVRSLQSVSSTPDSKCSPERDQGLDLDCDTLSESGWSVRDNPIAGDDEEDSPSSASMLGGRDMLTKSMESPYSINSCGEESCATQIHDEKTARLFGLADHFNSASEASMNGYLHDGRQDVHKSLNGNMHSDGLSDHLSVDRFSGGAKSSLDNPSKEDRTSRLLTLRRSSMCTSCARVLRKMHFYAEAFLLGALLIVLAFAACIAILSIKGEHDLHLLVPT